MQKNYFMKNVLAASMLLAVSLGMSSCSGFIDAVIGTSDQPTTQPTTQPTVASAVVTADQTTITISSFDDMAKAISAEQNEAFVKAIEAKAAAGEEYTINIKSEKPLSTEDFEGFAIPRVEGAAVNIVFDQPLVTSEESPLKITADEKNSDTPTTAVNELTINLPDGSDKVYLSVDMPETSVTLAGNVTYDYVEATTAINTLYVPSDAIIKEFYIKGGRVIVQNGGIIETYVYPASDGFIRISSDGVIPYRIAGVDNQGNEDWDNPVYQIADEQGNPYYIQNLKIVKGEAEYATIVHEIDKNKPFKKLIIADGAAVNYKNGEDIRIETIEGHGNARFLYGVSYESGNVPGEMVYTGNCDLEYVKNLSGVEFSPLWADKVEKENYVQIHQIPASAKDCTFKAFGIYNAGSGIENCTFIFNDMSVQREKYVSSFSLKNCKFEKNSLDTRCISVESPIPSDGESSFKATFDNCEFADGTNFYFDQDCGESKEVTVYVWSQIIDGAVYPGGSSTSLDDVPEYNKNVGETKDRYDDSKNPDQDHPNLSMGYWKETRQMLVLPVDKYDFTASFINCIHGGNAFTTSCLVDSEFKPYGINGLKFYVEINGTKYTPSYKWVETAQKNNIVLTPVS